MKRALALGILLAFSPSGIAAERDWDALIGKAEEPMTSFLAKFTNALRKRMEAAEEKGDATEAETLAAELKHIEAGGWPDGQSESDVVKKMEATFVIYFGRMRATVIERLGKVTAVDEFGKAKERIEKRLKYWNDVYAGKDTNENVIRFVWKIKAPLHTKLGERISRADQRPPQYLLEFQGIQFYEGSSASFDERKSELTVENSIRNMLKIDQLLRETELR